MSFVRVVTKGFAQWKRHPDATSQPPLLCPWLLGIPDPRDLSRSREKLGESSNTTNFEKNRKLKAEAHHNSLCSHPRAQGQAQTHELKSLANQKARGRFKKLPLAME